MKMKYITFLLSLLVLLVNGGDGVGGPPVDWIPRIKGGNMLYTPNDTLDDPYLMPIIANGYVGTVILDGTMYVGGVFNGRNSTDSPLGPSHRAAIPSTIAIMIGNANVYAAAIDVEFGIYYRRSATSSNVNIEQRWYAHREIPNLLVHEIEVDATKSNTPVMLELKLNTINSTDIDFTEINKGQVTLFNGSTLLSELSNGPLIQVSIATTTIPTTLSFQAMQISTYRFLSAISTSLDSSDPLTSASSLYYQYYNSSSLIASHIQAWQAIWESGIEIEGDAYLAAAVNNSLYEILSNIRPEWVYSVSPGGISTDGYNGHTFWDSETWMYPTILLFFPELAQTQQRLLEYRYNRLNTASLNAQAMNYTGAKFPWESAFTGIECTMYPPNIEGMYEVHINGDIARAVMQYFSVTGDQNWLKSIGFPILYGIAQYWESRISYDPISAQYVINNVQCPDESAQHVNNSIYTNVVAALSLTYALLYGKLLSVPTPPIWQTMASNIKIPFNATLQWHPEYDGYNGQQINQADVVLLQYPLGYPMNKVVAVNDLLYYQNHTDRNGMFTGDCSYSISWLRLQEPNNAEYYFNNTLLHLKPPFMVFTERIVGGIPHFITGAGGFLQNIVFGYTGLQIEGQNITIYPSILPYGQTTKVTLRKFSYLGNVLSLSFNSTHIIFTQESDTKQDNNAIILKPQAITQLYITPQNGNTDSLTGTLVYPIGKFTLHSG